MDVNVAPQQDLWLRAPLARSRLLATLIRAYVGNQGKGSYKRLALISIGTFIEMI